MKLYEVRCELVTYVLADDERDACREATDGLQWELDDGEWRRERRARMVKPHEALAPGWGPATLVWGADEEVTVAQALANYVETE